MFDLKNIVRNNILKLKPYSSARDEFTGNDGIFLDANENPFGTLNRYPDPNQSKLKRIIARRNGVVEDQIFIGNGSDEVIDLVFRVFCEPKKDKALTFLPTYGMYQVAADIHDVAMLKEKLDESFNINLQAVSKAITEENLKLILICSPNNPTGNCISHQTIVSILDSFSGIVLVDEAYIEFAPEKSVLSLIEEYPNLIVSKTLSKAWGLASARIGIAFANPEIIDVLHKVKPPYNISGPNQKAAIQVLKNSDQLESNVNSILKEKEKLIMELNQLDVIKKIYPSEANFLLIEFGDANKVYNDLIDNMIVVRNRNNQVKNCLRITVGNPAENKQLLDILKKINNE